MPCNDYSFQNLWYNLLLLKTEVRQSLRKANNTFFWLIEIWSSSEFMWTARKMCLGLRKAGRNTPLSCSKNRTASLGSEKGSNTDLSLGRIEGEATGSFFVGNHQSFYQRCFICIGMLWMGNCTTIGSWLLWLRSKTSASTERIFSSHTIYLKQSC